MNVREAGCVLAKVSAYDRRQVEDAAIVAWCEALADVTVEDALAAVGLYFRDHREWCMPSDVRRIALDLARERHRVVREAMEQAEMLALTAGPRTDRSAEIAAGIRSLLAIFSHDRGQRRTPSPATQRLSIPDPPGWIPPPQCGDCGAFMTDSRCFPCGNFTNDGGDNEFDHKKRKPPPGQTRHGEASR